MPKQFVRNLFVTILCGASATAFAQPEIHFTDYRVFLSEKKSKSDYEIFNQGQTAADCSTSIVDYNVAPDGTLALVKEGEGPATSGKDLLKISPRKIKINKMSSQKLKIFAKKLRRQEKKEWVSYLELTCRSADIKLNPGININPTFKYHVPIVIRNGNLQADAELVTPKIITENGNNFLQVSLEKTGNRSLYGAVTIKDSDGTQLGRRTGISHYLQTDSLDLKIALIRAPKGDVTVTFEENKKYGGQIETSIDVNAG